VRNDFSKAAWHGKAIDGSAKCQEKGGMAANISGISDTIGSQF
jgi:hypothetical protein